MSDTLLVGAFGVAGLLIGLAADALAHRWPEHEPDYQRRRFDWRTVTVAFVGGVGFAAIAARWSTDSQALLVLGVMGIALVLLLATDLDQRLLPDEVTLPLIVFAAAVLLLGWSPILAGKQFGLVSGIATAIVAPLLLLITDRIIGGQLGLGDVKLSVSLGLLFGASAMFYGMIVASLAFSAVLIALIAARRLSLKSVIPFGPVLILGAFAAAAMA